MEPPLPRHPRGGGKGGRAPGEERVEKGPFPVGRRRCEGRTGGESPWAPEERAPSAAGRKVENLDIFGLNGRMVDSV